MKKEINLEQELEPEKVYLVAGNQGDKNIEYSMAELNNLAISANYIVVGQTIQNLEKINPATYIGKGKIEEIKKEIEYLEADKIIFNDELTSVQLKNIEERLEIDVMDRTFLILEIFATRAQTKEAKLQVEVAKLKYELPRIRGSYTKFERQRGGGGTANRGKGEGLISLDKRRAEERITLLEKELETINHQRETQHKTQTKNETFEVALVGYTNAGKSTLMNQLAELPAEKEIFAKDLLFATLDTTTRQLNLVEGLNSTISDTVGFVDKLPTELIKAFQTTLSAVTGADLLIHLVDSQSPFLEEQKATTIETLDNLGVDQDKVLEIYNKSDLEDVEGHLSISALNGRNIDKLKEELRTIILANYEYKEEEVDYADYRRITELRNNPSIIKINEEKTEANIKVDYYQKINQKS